MNFWRPFLFLWMILSSLSVFGASSWFDHSHQALLPAQVDQKLLNYQEFPVFWWNFVVLEFPQHQEVPWSELREQCRSKFHSGTSSLRKSPCESLQGATMDLLSDWARDMVLRRPAPMQPEMDAKFQQALAKASLPMDSTLLGLIRLDPFNSIEEYQKLLLSRIGFSFENHQGLFFDPIRNRVLIPVQFKQKSSETTEFHLFVDQMKTLCDNLNCKVLGGVGPHFSTWENETQVREDVHIVSIVGWIVMAGFLVFFFLSKRAQLIFLFPPLFLAMVLAAFFTFLIFGSIHGLTLSFGPSIVGMAIDYGLHSAFSPQNEKGVWKANLFALFTSLAVFVVLFFSELPILRQIGVFSVFGLTLSSVFFYAMKRFQGVSFHVKPLDLQVPRWRIFGWFSLVLLVLGVVSPFFLKPDLSLQQLNYEAPDMKALRAWAYTSGKSASPLIEISDPKAMNVLEEAHAKALWGTANQVEFENVARYLPTLSVQEKNLASWNSLFCQKNLVSADLVEFFEPFWNSHLCADLDLQTLAHEQKPPAYLQDLSAQGKWVTLWFPKSGSEAEKIQAQFPQAESFVKILSLFAETLAKELKWMVPSALVFAFLFLLGYSKSFLKSLFALVPFFTGLGAYFAVCKMVDLNVSFISVIGLVMMFGFSIDYGIFMVNDLESKEQNVKDAVHSSITFAAFTTMLGFVPLMFAQHPALRHLGQSLFLGAFGSYMGALFAIPVLSEFLSKTESSQ